MCRVAETDRKIYLSAIAENIHNKDCYVAKVANHQHKVTEKHHRCYFMIGLLNWLYISFFTYIIISGCSCYIILHMATSNFATFDALWIKDMQFRTHYLILIITCYSWCIYRYTQITNHVGMPHFFIKKEIRITNLC